MELNGGSLAQRELQVGGPVGRLPRQGEHVVIKSMGCLINWPIPNPGSSTYCMTLSNSVASLTIRVFLFLFLFYFILFYFIYLFFILFFVFFSFLCSFLLFFVFSLACVRILAVAVVLC